MHFSGILLLAVLSVAVGNYVPQYEVHQPPRPYKFGYNVQDQHGQQQRQESGDGQSVRGSYGFTDSRGVQRQVNYVADQGGFRAQVQTNERGTANKNPADVQMMSSNQDKPEFMGGGYMEGGMGGGYMEGGMGGGYMEGGMGGGYMEGGMGGGYGQAPMASMSSMGKGYQYSAPLKGGSVSVYSS